MTGRSPSPIVNHPHEFAHNRVPLGGRQHAGSVCTCWNWRLPLRLDLSVDMAFANGSLACATVAIASKTVIRMFPRVSLPEHLGF